MHGQGERLCIHHSIDNADDSVLLPSIDPSALSLSSRLELRAEIINEKMREMHAEKGKVSKSKRGYHFKQPK